MAKEAFFFVDDVIWCMRDLAYKKPASLFDNEYFKMLKKCHDEWGATVQLNLFYRTDFFYGGKEFTLAEMPDNYKDEFRANSDWLRFAFHAKQEFPDYPYVNARYEDVKDDYEQLINEVKRFAGEEVISKNITPHWLPISKEGVRALYDCGIRFVSASAGPTTEYTGDESVLPYGHAARLLHNRQPETKLFTRNINDDRIKASICAYNHITAEEEKLLKKYNVTVEDKETGMRFRSSICGPCLNLYTVEEIKEILTQKEKDGVELMVCANHEQYFYPDYYAYQPDMAEKYYTMAKTLHDLGYTFITAEEFK